MKIAYINAKIFTAENENSFVDSFVVENGVFKNINEEIDLKSCDEIINLQGKTVIPALSDVHTHPTYVADIVDSLFCNQPNVYSIDEMIEYLKTSPNYGKEGMWIKGWCYDESKLKENRTPTILDLDKVSSTQPVFLQRSCGHSIVCNSVALKLAGISKDTPNPAGGEIKRFEDGSPNGFMYELSAANLIRDVMYKRDLMQDAKNIAKLSKHYASLGIVNLSDMMCFSKPYKAIDMYKLANEFGFKQRISIYYTWEDVKKNAFDGFIKDESLGEIKIAGIKFFMDGSLSSKSGAVLNAYKDGTKGFLVHSDDKDMIEAIAWAKEKKVQISFHAMGDAAIEKIIKYASKYDDNWMGEYPSIRIEHASLLSKEQIKKIATLKVKFSIHPQAIFSYAELDGYAAALNKSELNRVCALKTWDEILDKSITLSSDAPATIHQCPENPFVSIQAAVNRISVDGIAYNKDEEISVQKAIMMMSKHTAKSLMLDKVCEIKNGFSADFLVLNDDIFTMQKDKIKDLKVLQTFFKGELIYQA